MARQDITTARKLASVAERPYQRNDVYDYFTRDTVKNLRATKRAREIAQSRVARAVKAMQKTANATG